MAQSNFISKVQQIVKDLNPDINTRIGSALYFFLILPTGKVFEAIQALIDVVNKGVSLLTAEDPDQRDLLLSNFGLQRKAGTPSIGKLSVTVSPNLLFYVFPEGSLFTHESGINVESTEAVTINTGESLIGEIPVQTTVDTNTIFELGETFSSNLFGSLVESVEVSAQIGGGLNQETDDELIDRIVNSLTFTTITPPGIEATIKKEFTALVDVRVRKDKLKNRASLNRLSGLKADVYIKSRLDQKTDTIQINDQGKFVLSKPVVFILSTSSTVERTVINKGTHLEKNEFTTEDGSTTLVVTYLENPLLGEVQSFLDNPEKFPMGVDLLAVQANPVFVSGEILTSQDTTGILDKLKNFITNHKIDKFFISELITASGLTKYSTPIKLDFNGEEIVNEFTDAFSAYYVGELLIKQGTI